MEPKDGRRHNNGNAFVGVGAVVEVIDWGCPELGWLLIDGASLVVAAAVSVTCKAPGSVIQMHRTSTLVGKWWDSPKG